MTDGPDFPTPPGPEDLPLAGLDAERPLPPELKVRLEAALLAAVADGLPVPADTGALDAPRPLPEPLRARLEATLLAEAGAAAGEPAAAEVVPLERRRRKAVAWWSSVAAVLVLVLGAAGLVAVNGGGGSGKLQVAEPPTTTTAGTPASLPSGADVPTDTTSPSAGAPTPNDPASPGTTRGTKPRPTTTTTPPAPPQSAPPATSGDPNAALPPPAPPAGGATPPASEEGGWTSPPPPFYNGTSPARDASPPAMSAQPGPSSPSAGHQGAAPDDQPQKSGGGPAAGGTGPLRIGIIPGDPAQEAGFQDYIARLNQNGGLRDRLVELVTVGPGAPASGTIATVNLSGQPVATPNGAPGWVTGPLLETLTATEDLLPGGGSVFSFASPPERLAHLAADAVFPDPKAAVGRTAVIYAAAGGGLWGDVVPKAIEEVLTARGVRVRTVGYDPARASFADADREAAVFLSLDSAAAKDWLARARAESYRPSALAGIHSLFDDDLRADLPEGARLVSPYVIPEGDEGQAIRSAGSGRMSASVLHGWATAKTLAAALYQTGADTPAEVRSALESLAGSGWSSGLAPPYETRSGTRSRTPEGVVLRVQSGAFVADGGFRRDERS